LDLSNQRFPAIIKFNLSTELNFTHDLAILSKPEDTMYLFKDFNSNYTLDQYKDFIIEDLISYD